MKGCSTFCVLHFGKPALLDPITEMKYMKCTSSGNMSPNLQNEVHKMDFMTEAKYISCPSFDPDGEKWRDEMKGLVGVGYSTDSCFGVRPPRLKRSEPF
jgi:hypothetical protein